MDTTSKLQEERDLKKGQLRVEIVQRTSRQEENTSPLFPAMTPLAQSPLSNITQVKNSHSNPGSPTQAGGGKKMISPKKERLRKQF